MRETVNEFGVQGTYSGSYIRAKRAERLAPKPASHRLVWLLVWLIAFCGVCGCLVVLKRVL